MAFRFGLNMRCILLNIFFLANVITINAVMKLLGEKT